MTTQTVSGAVAVKDKADKLVGWLRAQQDEIAMAAASHIKPSTVVRIANGALRKDDKLMAAAIANPLSLLHCLLDAARLGHEPATDQYWLVPFGNEVTGIEGYKGIIERMFRAGAVSAVVAEVVHQRDIYRGQGPTTPPVHEYDEFADPADRGPLRGAYAYAVMLDGGCSHVIRMGRAEIMKHKAVSRGSDRPDSPWQKWEAAMWKKTPLRGLEPYVPTSTEWLAARAQAAAPARPVMVNGFTPPLPAGNGHGHQAAPEAIVDAEIVDEPQNDRPADPPAARASKRDVGELENLLAKFPWQNGDKTAFLTWRCGAPYRATKAQVTAVTNYLTGKLEAAQGDVEEALGAIWQEYHAQQDQDAESGPDTGGGDA